MMDELVEEIIHLVDDANKHPERYAWELNGKRVSTSKMRSEIVQENTIVVSLDVDGLFTNFYRVTVVIDRIEGDVK